MAKKDITGIKAPPPEGQNGPEGPETHVLASLKDFGDDLELNPEESLVVREQRAANAAYQELTGEAEDDPANHPPTVRSSGQSGNMKIIHLSSSGRTVESSPVTPQTVLVHAVRMGFSHIPAVAMAFGGDYRSAQACADAVCAALEPFAAAGLNIQQVRASLLLPPDADAPEICREIGGKPFVILGPCGRGGVGSTYFAAEATNPGRLLVLKTVTVDRTADGRMEPAVRQARDEPALLQKADELVASDEVDNGYQFTQLSVMPFHEGPSLSQLLSSAPGGRLPPKTACWIALCIARELKRLGDVWHLDLKGGNIIIKSDMRAKLIDYGAGRIAPVDKNSVELGIVMHTPEFSAPEMTAASPTATSTSDVYSLLIILYQMLSGEKAVPDSVGNGMSFKPYVVPSQQPTEVGASGAAQRTDLTEQLHPPDTFARITQATYDYKIGQTVEGKQGLLIHINTDDAGDPSGEKRSKIRQVTDWHSPLKDYADAGAKVREIFHDALQNDPGKRPSVARLVADLELVCRKLGVDPESGPVMDEVERDTTRMTGRQITPQALLAAIRHDDTDHYLRRVNTAVPAPEPGYEGAA